MGRVVHTHGDTSMIIQIIDDVRVAKLETKNNAPISLNGDRPKPFLVAFQGCSRRPGESISSMLTALSIKAKIN